MNYFKQKTLSRSPAAKPGRKDTTRNKQKDMNTIKELRAASGMTQQAFSEYFGFSRRAVQEWEAGRRECPVYLVSLVEYKLRNEGLLKDDTEKG